jgi:hypothetical protein
VAQRTERFEQDPVAYQEHRTRENARMRRDRVEKPNKYREGNYKKNYGMSLDDYDKMLAEQNGCCKVCGSSTSQTQRTEHFFVDHCHATGKVRGLLCIKCNAGIGNFCDDISKLEAAIRYLNEANMGGDARGAA